jgi:GT2 family glycosyltransferase
MIEIVSATRRSPADFWSQSALGQSLLRLNYDKRFVVRIAFENTRGLPLIYNTSLDSEDDAEAVVFIHDDVWIDDYFFADRVLEGLQHFDVIGVAGNKRILPNQPAWAFVDASMRWDDFSNLSGSVAHAEQPFGEITYFGPVPAACELLDGVLIAVNKARIKAAGVRFDPLFNFHFYDIDFCRSARRAGLSLGTWPICITHQSPGAFGTPSWRANLLHYAQKWFD